MPITNLDLQFKGERNYLHGTDIFSSTLSYLSSERGEIENIDFAFHHQGFHQLQIILGDLPEGLEPVAVCAFSSGGIREKAYLIETNQTIKNRYPYSEEEIASRLMIDLEERSAVLLGDVRHSEIETLVAMGKALHLKVFPELKGRWLFVRIRLNRYSKHLGSQERTIVIATIFNQKFTRCEAFYDGVKAGELYGCII